MRRLMFAGCAALVGLALTGCGEPEVEVGQVTGIVTIDGKPADRIGVAFLPLGEAASSTAPVATAVTDEQGRYELSYVVYSDDPNESPERKPGATLGTNAVVLDDARQKDEHLPESRVLQRYTQPELSGFQLDVQPGQQAYNIELRSR